MGRFLIEVKEYLRELGCFVLRLRLLLRLWVEEPESSMRGDLHVPNRTSIRKSIDGTLDGKMRLQKFEGSYGSSRDFSEWVEKGLSRVVMATGFFF
ncbi:Hypothetical predicted protein [Olea europaea subsp. europaea]|uniref:Uncharacterized protein n=1 Tax=Olea europaea subsp. europaea TaxID=158383 RepID=A0A8S0RQX3_OLEEU|nr:Hypothetical predicted protein [Olea europaea subsp. europaea]